MKPPCELIVKEILPYLRANLAKELLNKGLSQTEVSKSLGVTQGAVSQYMRSLRGRKNPIKENKEISTKMKKLAESIAISPDQEKIMKEFCEICKMIRKKGILCKRHKEEYPALKNCSICH